MGTDMERSNTDIWRERRDYWRLAAEMSAASRKRHEANATEEQAH